MEGYHWFCLVIFVFFIDIGTSINPQPQSRSTNTTQRTKIQIKPYRPYFGQTTVRSTLVVNNNLNDRYSYTTQRPTTLKTLINPRISNRPSFPFKPVDQLDISSSEDNLSWSWTQRRRYQSRWFRPPVATSTTNRPLEKLRKPKPTRPAMYSLNGYVPKPSLQFKPTTEAPNDVLAWKVIDLQALGSVTRRNKVKFDNDANQDDSIRRYGNKQKTVAPSTQENKRKTVPGRYRTSYRNGIAGLDFPAYESIPVTSFDCVDKLLGGMYADPETQCQVWHLCPGGHTQYRHSFLCANGTVFSERKGVCDWWYNVDC